MTSRHRYSPAGRLPSPNHACQANHPFASFPIRFPPPPPCHVACESDGHRQCVAAPIFATLKFCENSTMLKNLTIKTRLVFVIFLLSLTALAAGLVGLRNLG